MEARKKQYIGSLHFGSQPDALDFTLTAAQNVSRGPHDLSEGRTGEIPGGKQ